MINSVRKIIRRDQRKIRAREIRARERSQEINADINNIQNRTISAREETVPITNRNVDSPHNSIRNLINREGNRIRSRERVREREDRNEDENQERQRVSLF